MWCDLLEITDLKVDESVLEAGAASLTVISAAQILEEIFRVRVPVRVLFDQPTVAAQAHYLEQQDNGADSVRTTAARLLELADRGTAVG